MRAISRAHWCWSASRRSGGLKIFFDAIDSDDVARATSLMKKAKINASTIATVVRKVEDGDAEH